MVLVWLAACGDRVVETRTASIPAAELSRLRVVAVDGSIEVVARDVDDVWVTARLRAGDVAESDVDSDSDSDDGDASTPGADADALASEGASLDLVPDGEDARLEATVSDDVSSGYWFDVRVVVPDWMSGDFRGVTREIGAWNVPGVTIADDSGTILVKHVVGNVAIDDEAGSITVVDVDGDVTIKDGEGPVWVKHVTGDVTVDGGTGSVTLTDVDGATHVETESGVVDEE